MGIYKVTVDMVSDTTVCIIKKGKKGKVVPVLN
jgi:hypothetical protein